MKLTKNELEIKNGVSNAIPVNYSIPGCPPPPATGVSSLLQLKNIMLVYFSTGDETQSYKRRAVL
jgi:Ni,Fe-hydrogenase III small subunit